MTVLGSIFAVAIQEGIMVAGLGKTLKVDDQFVLDLNGWQISWHCYYENFLVHHTFCILYWRNEVKCIS